MNTIFNGNLKSDKVWPYYHETLAEHSALWADQYALTMSQALFTSGKHDVNTTFHQYIRKNPFNGGYLLTAGQNIVFEWLKDNWKFDETDIEILRNETVMDQKSGKPARLYSDDFLDMLQNSKFELTIDAMPEGEIAFPDEPIWRVNGPVWQCLMVEACILNVTNSQSLFATLASRLCKATEGDAVLEFGLRRAQALGGLESTRATYVGGAAGTSNMLAKKYYGIPSVGTMAHAYVMMHEDELEAFKDYATSMPNNSVFLIDTYDSIKGIQKAVKACKELNINLKGIRLDSGDLLNLSIEGRQILDEAGFTKATIAASNDLDEKTTLELKKNGAQINVWAYGTNLVTSKDQPALGGVYKLGAVYDYNRTISQEELDSLKQGVQSGLRNPEELNIFVRDTIKLSGDEIKVSIPGELDVIRHVKQVEGRFVFNGDTIINNLRVSPVADNTLTSAIVSVPKPANSATQEYAENSLAYRPLQRIFEKGVLVGDIGTVHDARLYAASALSLLDENVRSLQTPQAYPVGLEQELHQKRQNMINTLKAA